MKKLIYPISILLIIGVVILTRPNTAYATIILDDSDSGETTSSVTSVSAGGISTVNRAGDLIYVFCGWSNGNPGTVNVPTDTEGNTYVQIGSTLANSNNLVFSAQFYAKNIIGGTADNIVTCNWGTARSFVSIAVMEFSGVDTVSPLDTGTGCTGHSCTATNTEPTTSITTQTFTYGAGDVIAVGANNGADNRSYTAGDGYTLAPGVLNVAVMKMVEYSTSSNTSASISISTSARQNIMAALFKPQAAAAASAQNVKIKGGVKIRGGVKFR
ncbi:MAG: hypothetical protein HYT65_00870 [Candidatus Yanofskybacteria bacterium]|nr:hypothetical protein [Candidatus Yanofskybacteria bacterium]